MEVVSESVDVDALIAAIKRGVCIAGLSIESRERVLRIVTIGLKLEVVVESSQGGGLRFRVPIIGFEGNAGAHVTSRTTVVLALILEPQEKSVPSGMRAGDDVATAIVEAIETVRKTMQYAQGGTDPWLLRTGKVDIQFGITAEGSISLGVDRTQSHQHTNTLSIEIEPVS
jgi:hypothetical protein